MTVKRVNIKYNGGIRTQEDRAVKTILELRASLAEAKLTIIILQEKLKWLEQQH